MPVVPNGLCNGSKPLILNPRGHQPGEALRSVRMPSADLNVASQQQGLQPRRPALRPAAGLTSFGRCGSLGRFAFRSAFLARPAAAVHEAAVRIRQRVPAALRME